MAEPKIADTSPACQEMEPGTYYWCACGRSSTQPFCDGSHRDTEFVPMEITVTEAQTIAWCRCKRSGTKPFCDGTHKSLA